MKCTLGTWTGGHKEGDKVFFPMLFIFVLYTERKEALKIRTVISDLGKVLLDFDHMRSCRELAKCCGRSPESIYEALFRSDLGKDYDLGRITSEAFGRGVIERMGLDLQVEDIRRFWTAIFEPMKGMEGLVHALKDRYKLVLLSNTNEWHFACCRRTFPVVGYFEWFALSFQLGCRKPDPEIFLQALSMSGSDPAESIYIDDIAAYVESAESQGIHGILFESPNQLKRDLAAAGVDCS